MKDKLIYIGLTPTQINFLVNLTKLDYECDDAELIKEAEMNLRHPAEVLAVKDIIELIDNKIKSIDSKAIPFDRDDYRAKCEEMGMLLAIKEAILGLLAKPL